MTPRDLGREEKINTIIRVNHTEKLRKQTYILKKEFKIGRAFDCSEIPFYSCTESTLFICVLVSF